MGTVPSNNYTFDLLVEADDHAWAPAVADNGPGKEDIGAAGFAPSDSTLSSTRLAAYTPP